MVTYLITDEPRLLLGFRLQGAIGEVVSDEKLIHKAYTDCLKNENIGIVVLSDNIYKSIKDDVIRHIRTGKKPLTVTLPAIE